MATGDGNRATPGDRPATGDSYYQPCDYTANYRSWDFLSVEQEEKLRREDPPRKSLRKPPKFTRDPPPDMAEPPPRPRTRSSKKALNQRLTPHTPDATQPHPVPPAKHISEPSISSKHISEPPISSISEPSTTPTSSISEPSTTPTSSISEPSTTPTSVILSKLCQPVNVQEKREEKGEESETTSSLHPTPCSGNTQIVQTSGRESGQVVNQNSSSSHPTPCSGTTQSVQENGREKMLGENRNQLNVQGGQEQRQTLEKIEEVKETRGQNSPFPPYNHEQGQLHHEHTTTHAFITHGFSQNEPFSHMLTLSPNFDKHNNYQNPTHHYMSPTNPLSQQLLSPIQQIPSPTTYDFSTIISHPHSTHTATTLPPPNLSINNPHLHTIQTIVVPTTNSQPNSLIPHPHLSPTQPLYPTSSNTNLVVHTPSTLTPSSPPSTISFPNAHYPQSSTIPLPPPIFAPHSPQHPHAIDPTPHYHNSTSTFSPHKISNTTYSHPNILIPHLPLSPTQPNTQPPPVAPTPPHHTSTSSIPPNTNTNTSSYPTPVPPMPSSLPSHTLPHTSTNPIPPPQAHNNNLHPQAQTPTQSSTSNKIHQPNLSHPAHNHNPKENTHFPQSHNHHQHPPNSGPTYASILKSDPNPNRHKPLKRSFADIINGPAPPTVQIKSVSSFEGEPSVHFSADEIQAMAAPFKLTLVGKFSHNRPRLELIRKFFASLGLLGKSQISLLDNRHVLINLHVEDDYTRLWVKQTWYVCGSAMRIFKWTTDFLCSEESPVVPVWISFPYLPIHFVQCKEALFSIASAIGQPLRIDQATATLSRPSVARVLVEHDVTQPLLPRIRIGVGDSGFWQNVVYEKIPLYCASCKHLGHAAETCYVANPGLRPQRPNRAPPANPHTSKDRAAPPPGTSPRAPDPTPEHSSLAIQIVDSVSPITMISPVEADVPDSAAAPDLTPESQDTRAPDPGLTLPCVHGEIADHHIPSEPRSFSDDLDTTVVGFNTHCTDVPYDVEISDAEDQHFGYGGTHPHSEHQSGEDSDSDHLLVQDVYFLSAPEDNRRPDPAPDYSVTQRHSRKGFRLLTGRKYRR